jgi:hypothetical protein
MGLSMYNAFSAVGMGCGAGGAGNEGAGDVE